MQRYVRLGINIDHVATIRNARGGTHPDPVRAALTAVEAGADLITAHLREDRRHIRDDDVARLRAEVAAPLNLEVAASEEMTALALEHRPHAVCLVPERRTERTTEGGLDAIGGRRLLERIVPPLAAAGICTTLFVEPDPEQLRVAQAVGATAVELHTGRYSDLTDDARRAELNRLRTAAAAAHSLGLECHAGHGLTFDNVAPVAAIDGVVELNIGHFLVGEAVFSGLAAAIRRMRVLIHAAVANPAS
ncbi:MAG: pyridoxine 5'-phosphate synthase [Rhodospirillales bacterium]